MNKFRILQQYLKTKYRLRFSTREQVKQFHEQKITKHLLFVIDKSPFYRQLYTPFLKEIENGDLASLPIINKEVMMENFDTLNTASISKRKPFM